LVSNVHARGAREPPEGEQRERVCQGITAYLGSDLPSLWALLGLFLFVVPIVCGARFPVERFYSVNLTVMVLGIAAIDVFVAAPLHAIYRNTHPFNEGRNFYRSSAMKLTRQWHELSDHPLPLISGDEALAFAVPFYSPDHPQYKRAWDPPDTPRPPPLEKDGLQSVLVMTRVVWPLSTGPRPRIDLFDPSSAFGLLSWVRPVPRGK
jgi:hypothetical protein